MPSPAQFGAVSGRGGTNSVAFVDSAPGAAAPSVQSSSAVDSRLDPPRSSGSVVAVLGAPSGSGHARGESPRRANRATRWRPVPSSGAPDGWLGGAMSAGAVAGSGGSTSGAPMVGGLLAWLAAVELPAGSWSATRAGSCGRSCGLCPSNVPASWSRSQRVAAGVDRRPLSTTSKPTKRTVHKCNRTVCAVVAAQARWLTAQAPAQASAPASPRRQPIPPHKPTRPLVLRRSTVPARSSSVTSAMATGRPDQRLDGGDDRTTSPRQLSFARRAAALVRDARLAGGRSAGRSWWAPGTINSGVIVGVFVTGGVFAAIAGGPIWLGIGYAGLGLVIPTLRMLRQGQPAGFRRRDAGSGGYIARRPIRSAVPRPSRILLSRLWTSSVSLTDRRRARPPQRPRQRRPQRRRVAARERDRSCSSACH